jgi:hypothetical protein
MVVMATARAARYWGISPARRHEDRNRRNGPNERPRTSTGSVAREKCFLPPGGTDAKMSQDEDARRAAD